MKKIIIAGLSITMFYSMNAFALIINTDVGSLDFKIAQTTLVSSGAAIEEAWIESELGFDVDYMQFEDSASGAANWEAVYDGTSLLLGQYAFEFTSNLDPLYYLIKVGDGSGTNAADSHFLFQNEDSLNWAHIILTDFGPDVSVFNVGIISHVGSTAVPEPAIIALFATGLIGIGFARRRRQV